MATMSFDYLLKIIVIGDSAVGKSCLLSRFVDESFNQTSTIGVDFRIKTIDVDGTIVKLQIWDMAGQERFKVLVNSYYRGADIVFLVFDLSSRESFMNIPMWYQEADQLTLDNTKMLLIGCKADLGWEITQEEIQNMADRFGLLWCVCSALKGSGINEVFQTATRGWCRPEMVFEIEESKNTSTCCPCSIL